jgi:hypothetical protein
MRHGPSVTGVEVFVVLDGRRSQGCWSRIRTARTGGIWG